MAPNNPDQKMVLFDADGVLCVPPFLFAAKLAERGISPETTADFFRGAFNQCLRGNADTKELLKGYLDQWGWHEGVDSFMSMWHRAEHVMDPQVLRIIEELRNSNVRVGLATNQDRYRAAYMRKEMGVEDLFDVTYFSCEIGAAKPDPEYYEHICSGAKIPPGNLFFFDDSRSYVAAANAAGWNGHLYETAERCREQLKMHRLL